MNIFNLVLVSVAFPFTPLFLPLHTRLDLSADQPLMCDLKPVFCSVVALTLIECVIITLVRPMLHMHG